jgi:hypothetical protein
MTLTFIDALTEAPWLSVTVTDTEYRPGVDQAVDLFEEPHE